MKLLHVCASKDIFVFRPILKTHFQHKQRILSCLKELVTLGSSFGFEMHLDACRNINNKTLNNIITTPMGFAKHTNPGYQMLTGTAFTMKVGIRWCHKRNRKNSSTPIYAISLKSQNCTHPRELHKGEVNMLPMDATIPSRNKINFVTT